MTMDLHKLDAIGKRIPSSVTIPNEAHFLFDHVIKRAKKGVIEIGSWKGRSTVYLAKATKHIKIPMVAIDSWHNLNDSPDPKENMRDEWPEFTQNLVKAKITYHEYYEDIKIAKGLTEADWKNYGRQIMFGGGPDVHAIKMLSKPALKYFKESFMRIWFTDFKFDFLFIDADHSEEAVRWDFENWSAILSRPATVILHDVGAFPGPRKLFQYLVYVKKYDYKFINNMAAIYLQ